jgi:hypothetical protein
MICIAKKNKKKFNFLKIQRKYTFTKNIRRAITKIKMSLHTSR